MEGSRSPRDHPRRGPLSGTRVVDFCWMGVGAIATRALADFGAEVIRVESSTRLDTTRLLPFYKGEPARSYHDRSESPDPDRGGLYNNYNRNKLGVTLNLRTAAGQDIAAQLCATANVVTENFAPGVMERWGFDYERLRQLRPDIIFVRMSGYGHSGPDHEYRSYGPVVQAVSGLSASAGLPDLPPSGIGLSYMDNQAAYHATAAILMALRAHAQTGEGTEIDVSAVETGVSLLGPALLAAQAGDEATRARLPRVGNEEPWGTAAPHGVYPATGPDRWIAIAVFGDSEWANLVAALDDPEWAEDQRFSTQARRFEHRAELDELMSRCTRQWDAHDLMHHLQQHGVAAGAVQNASEVNDDDPQIAARGTFFELDHPVIGPARFEGIPMVFSRTDPDHWRSAPLLGEDNDHVFGELLGLTEDEIEAAGRAGAFT